MAGVRDQVLIRESASLRTLGGIRLLAFRPALPGPSLLRHPPPGRVPVPDGGVLAVARVPLQDPIELQAGPGVGLLLATGQPGAITVIQTFGSLGDWHPHLHILCTWGTFDQTDSFHQATTCPRPEDLQEAFRERVFRFLLREEAIDLETVDSMKAWPRSGFGAHIGASIEVTSRSDGSCRAPTNLLEYFVRPTVSLRKLELADEGQVILRSDKIHPRYKAQLEGEAGARVPAPPATPTGHADAVRAALDRTRSLHPRLGWLTWDQAAVIDEQPVPAIGFRLLLGSPRSMDSVYLWKTRETLPAGKKPLFCIPPDPIPTVPPWMASVRSLVEKELRPIELTIGYDRGQREGKTFLAVGRTAPDRWFSITCYADPDSEAAKVIDWARQLDGVVRDRGVDAVVQAAANLLDTEPTGAGDRFIVQSFVPLADKQFLELYIRLRPAREALPDASPALENGQRFHQHDVMGVVTQTFRWLGKLPVVESKRGPEPAVDTFTGKRVDEELAGYEYTGFVGRYDVTLQGRASARKELPERLRQTIQQMFPNLTPDLK